MRRRIVRRRNSNRRGISISQIQALRTERARKLDEKFKAKLAKSPEQWAKYPNRYDLKEVDYPKPKRRKLVGPRMIQYVKRTGKITHETPIRNVPKILRKKRIEGDVFVYPGWESAPQFVDKDVAALIYINIPSRYRDYVSIGMRNDELCYAGDIPIEWIDKIVEAKTGKVIYSKQ